jgi:hypothetical protein
MHHGTSNERTLPTLSLSTRRAAIRGTTKFVAGAALTMIASSRWVQTTTAQDDAVTLIADNAQVSASAGSAIAHGAIAEAVAGGGTARVQAAAALAEAESDHGAITQGAAAMAAAEPDGGAVAQSAVAVASAASEDHNASVPISKGAPRVITPAGSGGGGGGSRSGGRGMRAGISGDSGTDRERRRKRPASFPSVGVGLEQPRSWTSMLSMASAAAAAGAAILRFRGEVA